MKNSTGAEFSLKSSSGSQTFHAFYETWNFITCRLTEYWWMNEFTTDKSSPCFPSHFLKICFKNIFLPTLLSSKWLLSFPQVSPSNPLNTSLLTHMCHTLNHPNLLDLNTHTKHLKSPRYSVFSTFLLTRLLRSNIKFNQNPPFGSRFVLSGRTDMTKLIVGFRDFANALKYPRYWYNLFDKITCSFSSDYQCYVFTMGQRKLFCHLLTV